MNDDLFLWVVFRDFILVPAKQPMLILYFLQNGWILAEVITPDRYFSFLMKSFCKIFISEIVDTFYKTEHRSWYITVLSTIFENLFHVISTLA